MHCLVRRGGPTMIKSLFAVSSLVSMAGLGIVCFAAGCSDNAPQSSTATNEPADTAEKAPPNTSTPAPPTSTDDSTKKSDDGSDTPEEPKTCMDTKPFDGSSLSFKSPAVKPGSCSSADLAAFDDYMQKNPKTSVDDMKTAVTKQSKTCSDCVFGTADDDKWAPILMGATSASVNAGGCVAAISGKDACGKTYDQWNACLNTACAACSTDEGTQCKQDAQNPKAPCGELSTALFEACGKDVNDYLKSCFGGPSVVSAVVAELCGPASKDGGT
jgi:hypothetical protein